MVQALELLVITSALIPAYSALNLFLTGQS